MTDQLRRNRKYKAFLIVFFVTSMMLVFDKVTGGEWASIVMAVFASYGAANVGERFARKKED